MMGYFGQSSRQHRDSRKLYPSDVIAEVWANQQAESGRCSGNMSFDGVNFSSYSTVVATIAEHEGRKAYLLTEERYSATTARHMSHIRQAVRNDAKSFEVPVVNSNPARVLAAWHDQIARKLADFDENPCINYLREAAAMIAAMTEFADYFGLPLKTVKVPAVEPLLAKWQKAANKILAKRKRSPQDLHVAFTIEAYRVFVKMRTLARGASIPIDNYRVTLPMKETDIKAAIEAFEQAGEVKKRLVRSAPSTSGGMLDALLAGLPTSNQPQQPDLFV